MRREFFSYQMQKVGIPLIYIRCVRALYGGMRASARGPGGFSPTFPIAQGTREGCILSPLLFLIFFADIICVLEPVNLDEGAIMMGALYLARILFADDVFKFPTTGSLMMRGSGRLSLSLAARLTREYLRVPFWLFFNKR